MGSELCISADAIARLPRSGDAQRGHLFRRVPQPTRRAPRRAIEEGAATRSDTCRIAGGVGRSWRGWSAFAACPAHRGARACAARLTLGERSTDGRFARVTPILAAILRIPNAAHPTSGRARADGRCAGRRGAAAAGGLPVRRKPRRCSGAPTNPGQSAGQAQVRRGRRPDHTPGQLGAGTRTQSFQRRAARRAQSAADLGHGQDRVLQAQADGTGEKKSEASALFRSVGSQSKGVWVASPVEFSETGPWGAQVSAAAGSDAPKVARMNFEVKDKFSAPGYGDPAVRSATPTEKDVGGDLSHLCTNQPPCKLHALSIAQALEPGQKPLVATFATPALCTSATCGPELDAILQLNDKYGEAGQLRPRRDLPVPLRRREGRTRRSTSGTCRAIRGSSSSISPASSATDSRAPRPLTRSSPPSKPSSASPPNASHRKRAVGSVPIAFVATTRRGAPTFVW